MCLFGIRERGWSDGKEISNVVLERPANDVVGEICPESAEELIRVSSDGELEEKLSEDGSAIGIDLSSGKAEVILYESTKKADAHRTDYALSLLYGKEKVRKP